MRRLHSQARLERRVDVSAQPVGVESRQASPVGQADIPCAMACRIARDRRRWRDEANSERHERVGRGSQGALDSAGLTSISA